MPNWRPGGLAGKACAVSAALLTCAMLLSACTEAPGRSTAPRPTREFSSAPATRSPSPPPVDAPAVPNVVGMRLSDGQTLLRNQGFVSINAADATGQGRTVLEPTNWIIRSQNPPAGTSQTPGMVITLGVVKPSDGLPSPQVTVGVVPNVVCLSLQNAQEALRAAGFYVLVSKDGLGQGRVPVLDRNWIVIGQSAAPSTTPGRAQPIELTVVKYGEPTGDSGCQS